MAAAAPQLPSDRFALRWNGFPDNVTAIFRWLIGVLCDPQAAPARRSARRRNSHVCGREPGWAIRSLSLDGKFLLILGGGSQGSPLVLKLLFSSVSSREHTGRKPE